MFFCLSVSLSLSLYVCVYICVCCVHWQVIDIVGLCNVMKYVVDIVFCMVSCEYITCCMKHETQLVHLWYDVISSCVQGEMSWEKWFVAALTVVCLTMLCYFSYSNSLLYPYYTIANLTILYQRINLFPDTTDVKTSDVLLCSPFSTLMTCMCL